MTPISYADRIYRSKDQPRVKKPRRSFCRHNQSNTASHGVTATATNAIAEGAGAVAAGVKGIGEFVRSYGNGTFTLTSQRPKLRQVTETTR